MNTDSQMERLGFKKGGYTIQRGDTLSELAVRFDTSVKELLRANKKIKDPDLIFAGAKLNIPEKVVKSTVKAGEIPEEDLKKLNAVKVNYRRRGQEPTKDNKPVSKNEEDIIKFAEIDNNIVINPTDKDFLLKEKTKRARKFILPLFVRQFLYDTVGGDDDITEEDFSDEEYKKLQEAVKLSLKKGRKNINYDTMREVGATVGDVRKGDFSFFNPADSVNLTLGNANIKVEDDGNIFVKDQYNWNDAEGKRYSGKIFDESGLLPLSKADSFNNLIYRLARNFKTITGRGEGKGSKSNIFIGNVKDFGL